MKKILRMDIRCIFLIIAIFTLTACGGSRFPVPKGNSNSSNTAPSNVRLLEVSSAAVGAMAISWLPASDDKTQASALKYQIHASTSADFTPSAQTLKFEAVGVTSAIVNSGINPGANYTVRLVAIDAQGASTTSDSLQVTISNTTAKIVSGVKVQEMRAAQVTSVTANTVSLQAGVSVPAVGNFISNADANGGLGYLRKVVGIKQAGRETTLQTQAASINEVISDIQVSSTFKMDVIPKEIANTGVQAGLAVAGAKQVEGERVQHTFNWPETGLRYQTGVSSTSAIGHQMGLVVSAGFKADNDVTQAGKWGKVTGENRIEIKETAIGEIKLRLFITSNDKPWNSNSAVGICKVTLGSVKATGDDGKADKVSVSLGDFTKLTTVDGNRITTADQVLKFSADTTAATDKPYKITATAYLDDAGDGCNGDGIGTWRETIDFELEIFVTVDAFPTEEETEKVFNGSAGFSVKNNIVTTFSPKVTFDKTMSGARLTYAKMGVQASPRVDQILTIDATAQGSMDKTVEVINPRKFFKVYVTPAGIPIVVSGELRLDMRIQGDVSGELHATEKFTIGYDDIQFGVEYKNNQFVPYKTIKPVYQIRIAGNGKAEANLNISLLPSLEITGYEVLTGKVVLEPYMSASAGVEGHVKLDADVLVNTGQIDVAADADYRLTKTTLSGGVNAWLYADFHIWEKTLKVWPETANKDDYTSYEKVELLPKTDIMALPTLDAFLPTGSGTIHPQDTCAIKIRATSANLPNPLFSLFPFMEQSYIKWQRWTPARIVQQLGIPGNSYSFLPDPNGEEGVFWAKMTKPGIYTVRVGGYSNWGEWARQYTEIQIDATDANMNGIPDWWEIRYGLSGTGAAIASSDADGDGKNNLQEWQQCSDPKVSVNLGNVNVTPSNPTVSESVLFWVSGAFQSVKSVVWNFGAGISEKTADVFNGVSNTVSQLFSSSGVKDVTVTFKDGSGNVLGQKSTAVNINALPIASIAGISPKEMMRTLSGTYTISGSNLPTSGLSITLPTDTNASCKTPVNATASGFSVECNFKKVGVQIMEVRNGAQLIGSVNVLVKTNVTGVTWTSPSTTTSGTVKFGETATFTVAGINLLADTKMGFAVQLCGVSNTEIGSGSNIARQFVCNFNNEAGAVAGQMPGVVKDAPDGQVLFDGWNVPVEVAVKPNTGKLTDTGITSAQCYQAGSNSLVSCSSAAAIALNDKQDGMLGRDVSNPDNTDGKLGFSYSMVGNYAKTECVKDNITGLTWEGKPTSGVRAATNKYTNHGDKRSGDATAYVDAVNATGLCGYSDWRLPTADELQSLVDYGAAPPSPTIDTSWFPNTQSYLYWTSLSYAGNSGKGWYVVFYNGDVSFNVRLNTFHVRLVR